MPKRKWPAFVSVGLLLAGMLGGMLHFAGIESSGSYPAMSSLDAGPKGAKLLFDSLASIQSLTVSRNYRPLNQWHPSATAILLLAVRADTLNNTDARYIAMLERLSQPNNRLILALTDDVLQFPAGDPKKPPAIIARWGLTAINAGPRKKAELRIEHDSSWRELSAAKYAWEKHFGKGGTVVVVQHSGLFANEKVIADKTSQALVPALLGNNSSVAFEETHLGLEESGSIMGLARRYRLQGLIGGLLLLVVLLIWNQSVGFPPPRLFETRQTTQVVGAGIGDMFADLIARHLTPRALIESCVAEWNRVRPQRRITGEFQSKIDPVSTYRQLQEGLRSKSSRI
jgi:hypothetical protein